MFFNELKVLVFMRSGSRRPDTVADPNRPSNTMRGLGMGGCGWPPFVDCSSRDDEEEYYGSDPRPRSLAFEEKDPKLQAGLDAVSLASSTASGMRTPQCRICFQGPEQVADLFFIRYAWTFDLSLSFENIILYLKGKFKWHIILPWCTRDSNELQAGAYNHIKSSCSLCLLRTYVNTHLHEHYIWLQKILMATIVLLSIRVSVFSHES